MRNNGNQNRCENCGKAGLQVRKVTRSYGKGATLLVIEKVPEDYQDLKSRVKSTEERNQFLEKNLHELYAKRSEVDEKSAKYDELTEAIKQSQGQLNSYQRRIASYKNFMSLFQKADQLIMEISGLAYSKETQLIDLDGLVKSEFNDLVDRGLKLFNDLDKKRQPQNILEGELLVEPLNMSIIPFIPNHLNNEIYNNSKVINNNNKKKVDSVTNLRSYGLHNFYIII